MPACRSSTLWRVAKAAMPRRHSHMHPPGMQRHIHNALNVGATIEEITEVFTLCAVQGVHSCTMAISIVVEALSERSANDPSSA
jgi:alkylhydroperoxidase/carboxymuconolactone decarboxylase family protein YurZ